MTAIRQDLATRIDPATPRPDAEPVAAPRNDVAYLSAYEAAAREIFVKAHGLEFYYRTYYRSAGVVGWGAGDRKDDREEFVWRKG